MLKREKVFITGCGGMLGNAVFPFFKSWYGEVFATDKVANEPWLTQLDIRDTDGLKKVFGEYRPDIVLHLAAETDLEYCETHPEIARDVNETATRTIAQLSETHGATMIYISTAGVFDGTKSGYYSEQDAANPLMVYGQTKYDGEVHTLSECSRSYVVRAGWMMGGGREKEKKFIYKILRQVGEGKKEIFAVDDKWGTPTYTYDFAMNLFLLMETGQYGRYHMVCGGKGTRYDVAKELLHICGRDDIKLTRVGSDFFQKDYFAPRPYSEMMINENLGKLGINLMRPWEEALKDYVRNYFSDYIRPKASFPLSESASRTTEDGANGSKRRRFMRQNYLGSIDYFIKGKECSGKEGHQNLKKALIVNQSSSGLCLFTFEPIQEGDTVVLVEKADIIKKTATQTRWVKKEENGIFKAGLMFQQEA